MRAVKRASMICLGLYVVTTTAFADESQDMKLCIMTPKDVNASIAACTRLIDHPPMMDTTRHHWFVARARHKRKAGDHDGAIADFGEAIRLRPKDPKLYEMRAELHAELGHEAKANADFKKAKQLYKAGGTTRHP